MFPWLDADDRVVKRGVTNLHACFYMRRWVDFIFFYFYFLFSLLKRSRRSVQLRYAFAAAVGKRHFTERVSSLGRSAIIEHHRSVQWSEKEYVQLLALVGEMGSTIEKELVEQFSPSLPMFVDYSGILPSSHPIPTRTLSRMGGGRGS